MDTKSPGGEETTPDDFYAGREHAEVKHYLLKTYLERYLMILGQSASNLAYVDAFSGPWLSGMENHQDTSFGLAWTTAVRCSGALANNKKYPHIRQLWIEAEDGAYDRLKIFAAGKKESKVSVEAIPGRFQDNIQKIVEWIGNDYAFVLIDPKGYKSLIEPSVLAPLLSKPRVEVVVNYMWQFIDYALRQIDQPGNRSNMVSIFGEECAEISSIADPTEREQCFLELYEKRLRKVVPSFGLKKLRVHSFPIHHTNRRLIAKYYLVYVTHDSKGLITFAETADKATDKQQAVFYTTHSRKRERQSGVSDLFGVDMDTLGRGEESSPTPWLGLMPNVGDEISVNEEVWADLIEDSRCRPSQLQKGLGMLLKAGAVQNLDAKGVRRARFVHHEKGERIRRLK